jgi:hypothetical protein
MERYGWQRVPAAVSASGQSTLDIGFAFSILPMLPGAPLPHLAFGSIMRGSFDRMPFALKLTLTLRRTLGISRESLAESR